MAKKTPKPVPAAKPVKPVKPVKRSPAKSKAKSTATKAKPESASDRVIDGDKAFAKHVGKSTRTIQSWRDKGLPHEELGPNKYRYKLDETEPWIEANGSKEDLTAELRKLKEEDARAKLRRNIARANREEREEEARQGNIFPRDQYEADLVEMVHQAKGQLEQLPFQIRSHCCRKCEKSVPIEAEKLINKLLEIIARGPRKS